MASVTPGNKQEQEEGEKKATGTLFGFFKKTSEPSKLPLAPLCSNTVSLKNPTPKGSSSSAPKTKTTTKKATKTTAARGVTPDVKSLHENKGSTGIASVSSSSQSAGDDDMVEDAIIMSTSSLSGSHPVTITKSECDLEDISNTDDRSPFQRMGSDSSTPFIRGIAQNDSDDVDEGPVSGLGHGSPVMQDKFSTTEVKEDQSKEINVVQMEVVKEASVVSDSAKVEKQQETGEVVDMTDDQPANEEASSSSSSSSSSSTTAAAKKTTASSAKEKKPRAKREKAQPSAGGGATAPKKAARGSKAATSSSSTTATSVGEGEETATATTETTDEAMAVDGEPTAEKENTTETSVVAVVPSTGEINKTKGKRKASIGASLAASAVARAEAAEEVELPVEIAKKVQCNKDRMEAAVTDLVQLERYVLYRLSLTSQLLCRLLLLLLHLLKCFYSNEGTFISHCNRIVFFHNYSSTFPPT